MILKFTDVNVNSYVLEVYQENDKVTFQTSSPECVTDVTISKENLFDLIGALLTLQAKLKKTTTLDELSKRCAEIRSSSNIRF